MKPMVLALLAALAVSASGRAQELRQRHEPSWTWAPLEPLENQVSTEVHADFRFIFSNGVPDHAPGTFPNPGNPNTIREQEHAFRVPREPRLADRVTPLGPRPFGVAVNGVPFDPGTAERWGDGTDAWHHEAMTGSLDLGLDEHHAHVQPNGSYHYHGIPRGLVASLGGTGRPIFLGWAADGFGIYDEHCHRDPLDEGSDLRPMRSSFRRRGGARDGGPGGLHDGTFFEDWEHEPGAGDLDGCNGHYGVTPEDPQGTYHYHLTESFPFVPRCWRGTPDDSFRHGGPPPWAGVHGPRVGPGPGPEDFAMPPGVRIHRRGHPGDRGGAPGDRGRRWGGSSWGDRPHGPPPPGHAPPPPGRRPPPR